MVRGGTLRTLGFVGIALLVGLAVWMTRQNLQQDQIAVQEIEDLGGTVRRAEYGRAVDLCFREVTDDDLAVLERLHGLQLLDLRYSQITDNGLRRVGKLKGLTNLNLAHTTISGAGLHHLANLALVGLHLQSTFLNDEGLATLRPMHSLRRLDLGMSHVSDKSIPFLSKLKNLEFLNLCDTDCTANGIAQLEAALPETSIYSGSGRDSLGMGGELALPGEASWAMSNGRRTLRRVENLQPPFQLVDCALFADGGTQGLHLRDSTGSDLFFCLTPTGEEFYEFLPDRAYIGGFHPSSPGCRLLPLDTEELPRLIRHLEDAIENSSTNPGIDPYQYERKQNVATLLLNRLKAFAQAATPE